MNKPSFDELVQRYLRHQRALGRHYCGEERVFLSLCRYLHGQEATDLDQNGFEAWCASFPHVSPNVTRHRQLAVRKLCLFRSRTEPGCFVPNQDRFARRTRYITPVIFGPDEVGRMLEAADNLVGAPNSPLRPAVLRLAIVLLYTAGLRRGELLRLTLGDVDAKSGTLRIRESKFHKSRLIPLSADAQRELRRYLKKRLAAPFDTRSSSALLGNLHSPHGTLRAYTGTGLSCGIYELVHAARVQDADGRRPRVHDFRHSFAIQVLLRWYRQGADVQSKLPKLAMYMGHVSIVSTAYYLQWIPALAQAASQRFETCFGHLIDGGLS